MKELLPYHCPTLNGWYLRPPCLIQVIAAEAYQAKFAHAIMPYGLEQCLKCRGSVLISTATNEVAKIITSPELSTCAISQTDSSDACQNERENMTEIMIAQETPPAPRCPKHPDEPQVQCGSDSKRAGQYLGQCRKCMSERRARRDNDKMTPAVLRDLKKKQESPAEDLCPGVNPVLVLNFSHYPELFERVNAEALINMRTPDMQALWMLKMEIDKGSPTAL